jgi:hypothetical protein
VGLGGRFAIFDVVAASDAPLHYPVPWVQTADTSFPVTAGHMRNLLLEQKFQIAEWADEPAERTRARLASGDGARLQRNDEESRAQPA